MQAVHPNTVPGSARISGICWRVQVLRRPAGEALPQPSCRSCRRQRVRGHNAADPGSAHLFHIPPPRRRVRAAVEAPLIGCPGDPDRGSERGVRIATRLRAPGAKDEGRVARGVLLPPPWTSSAGARVGGPVVKRPAVSRRVSSIAARPVEAERGRAGRAAPLATDGGAALPDVVLGDTPRQGSTMMFYPTGMPRDAACVATLALRADCSDAQDNDGALAPGTPDEGPRPLSAWAGFRPPDTTLWGFQSEDGGQRALAGDSPPLGNIAQGMSKRDRWTPLGHAFADADMTRGLFQTGSLPRAERCLTWGAGSFASRPRPCPRRSGEDLPSSERRTLCGRSSEPRPHGTPRQISQRGLSRLPRRGSLDQGRGSGLLRRHPPGA